MIHAPQACLSRAFSRRDSSSQRSTSKTAARGVLSFTAAIALVIALGTSASAAPGDTSDDTSVANVRGTSSILLSVPTPSFTLNGLPGASVTGLAPVTMNVSTNSLGGYAVTVLAADQVLSATDAGNPDSIPMVALQVRESAEGDNGSFTSLSDAGSVSVHTQGVRSAEGGDALSNDFRVTIPFGAEDMYAVTLNYVATTR